MKEMLCNSVFFGVMVSILAYEIGMFLKKKWKLAIFNPLLVSIVIVIVFLAVFHIDYESYETGCASSELSADACDSLPGDSVV